jgi:serine/threonine-protein kinase
VVSPDGKWLAYRTTESGKPDVWIRDFYPGRTPVFGSEKIQVSVDGGDKPRWNRNGSELFFFNGTDLMTASIKPEGTTLKVGIPAKLFSTRYASYTPYDVLHDGTFVVNAMNESSRPGAPTPMRVLLNWEAAIKK